METATAKLVNASIKLLRGPLLSEVCGKSFGVDWNFHPLCFAQDRREITNRRLVTSALDLNTLVNLAPIAAMEIMP
jgi:hypothetical protein